MSSTRSEVAGVLALAAALGVAAGLVATPAVESAAVFVDGASLSAEVGVRPCSDAWPAAVATLGPSRHHDFGASSAIPGTTPPPGLLVCDPTGAFRLSGGLEESVADPGGPLAVGQAAALALWLRVTDAGADGDVLWLVQDDGPDLGLRVAGGRLQLVQDVAGAGDDGEEAPPEVLADVAAPTAGARLVAVSRSGSDVRLWVGTTGVATAPAAPAGEGPVTLRLGARPGTGDAAARAVLDEVLVLPAALGGGDVAALVAANVW